MYCKSPYSIWSNPEKHHVELGWNPVYQGRNVAQYSTTHESLEVLNKENKEKEQEDISAPCGTTAIEI